MLALFRKYQRFFFIIVAVFIIISFSFFGTYNVQVKEKKRDKDIGIAVDGSCIKRSELDLLCYFLVAHQNENMNSALIDSDIIGKDFLETRIAPLLIEKYFDVVRGDFQERLEKAKKFYYYSHPQAPQLSVQEIWKKFAPQINSLIERLSQEGKATVDVFQILSQLYLEQKKFPPHMLKRILLYQQKRSSNLRIDPNLLQADLFLFGFKNNVEWFGQNFLDLISQFIYNVSILAEKKGYSVTYNEASSDLLKEAYLVRKNKNSSKFNLRQHLQMFGVDEKSAVLTWKRILLFRKYFNDVGNNIFLDSFSCGDFFAHANETVNIRLFQLPAYLHMKDFDHLMKLQVYLTGVAHVENPLDLPEVYLPVASVRQQFPEFIERSYLIKVARVDILDVGTRVGERELWQWQLENWKIIQNRFLDLRKCRVTSREERFKALENLDGASRAKIDTFCREKIIKEIHPEWIEEALSKEEKKEMALKVRVKGGKSPFPEISKSSLDKFLRDALRNEDREVSNFTEDGKTYYSLEILKRGEKEEIALFKDLLQDGTLDEVVDRYLEKKYVEIREGMPEKFMKETGQWKDFVQVKKQVGILVFSPVLKAIDRDYFQQKGKLDKGSFFDFYAKYRTFYPLRRERERLKKNMNDYLCNNVFRDQWKLEQKEEKVTRSFNNVWVRDQIFKNNLKAWSDIFHTKDGNALFFYIEGRENEDKLIDDRVRVGRENLAAEAKCRLTSQILDRFFQKKVIYLPIDRG